MTDFTTYSHKIPPRELLYYQVRMRAIVVGVAKNHAIGRRNDLPWHLRSDLKHFKALTLGKKVVMGEKTFQSILDRLGRPLPERDTIVLSRDRGFSYPGVTILNDTAQLDGIEGDLYICGGAQIYAATIASCDNLFVTEVHTVIEDADAFFPVIDQQIWQETSRETHTADQFNDYDFDFVTYERR